MEKSKLLLVTYDAQLTELKVVPKCRKTKVSYKLKLYDNELRQQVKKTIFFEEVAAIEFRMNYFDNPIGNIAAYRLFQQQTTGGIYLILAKKWGIISK